MYGWKLGDRLLKRLKTEKNNQMVMMEFTR
jgi:hypothetical protein